MTQTGTKSACAPVLLIEDEPAVMALVRAVLEGYGYAVVATESGASALQLLEEGNFHGVAPTGKKIKARGMQIARFEDGRIAERWGSSDELGIFKQLGVDPTGGK